MRGLLFVIIVLGLCCKVEAHGDLHERIAKVTQEISIDSLNPQLYYKRGQLYFHHEEYDNALADFAKAKALNLPTDEVEYWKARLYLQINQTTAGIETITQYLTQHPTDVNARRIYGKLAEQAKDLPTAITQFELVINLTTTPLPDNYMELVAILKQNNSYQNAINWLEKGAERLGTLYVFDAEMIEIFKLQDNYPQAIVVYKRLADGSNRKESYLFEIGKCYLTLGDKIEAKKHFDLSINALKKLPQHLQETNAMKELAENIKTAYESL